MHRRDRPLLRGVLERQPSFREAVRADARLALDRGSGPTPSSVDEVRALDVVRLLWSADGFSAMACYRLRATCLRAGIPIVPRLAQGLATVGSRVCIGEPVLLAPGIHLPQGDVVIDGYTEIGSGVTIEAGVCIGLLEGNPRGPRIDADVHIGAGAKVVGPVVVGAGATIGAHAVVVRDVAPGAVVPGISEAGEAPSAAWVREHGAESRSAHRSGVVAPVVEPRPLEQPRFWRGVAGDAEITAQFRRERTVFRSRLDTVGQVVRLAWAADAFLAQVCVRAKLAARARGIPVLPALFDGLARATAQVSIGDDVVLGPGVLFPHGLVDIDGAAFVGPGSVIRPFVTLGPIDGESIGPTLGARTLVGTGARVVGPVTIGANVQIGANAVVIEDVPAGTTAVGIPARVLARVYLPGADLSGTDQAGKHLRSRDLTGASFARADLTRTDLYESVLADADLRGATLVDAHLGNVDLRGACLQHADLTRAKLVNADLRGADLTGADLTGATLLLVASGSIKGVPTALPGAWRLVDGYLVGEGANLTGADLREADLRGASLRRAQLRDGDLTGADLRDADLREANLRRAQLEGADLTGADLTGADLTGARGLPPG